MYIGNVFIESPIFLAPMAGITDKAFRLVCREMGCGMVYSEMVSAKGLFYGSENTNKLMEMQPNEQPIAIQLFGSDPKLMGNMAKQIQHLNFDVIDVNMGCPAQKIVKNGEGSALMKTPKLIGEIVYAMTQSQQKPVTVKIRKGFDENTITAVEAAKQAEENGAAAIAIHGRTREEYYSGNADWNIIKEVKKAVNIPVIGNGDVLTPMDAVAMLDETGCDAVMIGRGAEGNPWIFSQCKHFMKTAELLPPPTMEERIAKALYHAALIVEYKGEYTGVREMRRHLSFYLKGMSGAANLRGKLNAAQSLADIKALLK